MLNAPVKRIPLWNFVTAVALVMLLPDGGNSLAICAFISIQYQTVTDRPTHRFAITVLTHDKNVHLVARNLP